MKLRKNSGKILWGLFFILAAVYVVVSKLWIMPEVSVFSILLTVFFIWLFLNGIRNVNFWEILFSIAFICIIYDDWLGITALTPWTVLGAALLGSIGLSLIFKKKSGHKPSISFEYDSDDDDEKYIGENIKIDNNFGTAIKYVNSDNFCMADGIIALVRLPYTLIMPLSSPEVQKSKLTIALAKQIFTFRKNGKQRTTLVRHSEASKYMVYAREAVITL